MYTTRATSLSGIVRCIHTRRASYGVEKWVIETMSRHRATNR